MASELQALVLGFDYSLIVRSLLEEMLRRAVPLEDYLYIKTVFDVVDKDGSTTEKRLQIDVLSLRESYARGEVTTLGWVPGNLNAADSVNKTMTKASTPLWSLMK